MRFIGLAVTGPAGAVSVELMQSSVGNFPLEANLPDAHSWDELVRSEVISDQSWLIASRAKQGGATRMVVVRIDDAYTEDFLCMARADVTADRPDDAVFAELEGICRTMSLGRAAGPCVPASSTAPPPASTH